MAVLDLLTERAPRTHLNRIEASIRDSDPYGIDVQLTLYVCYELHYRGFAGVDAGWEWNPGLLHLRAQLEESFLTAVRRDVGEIDPARQRRRRDGAVVDRAGRRLGTVVLTCAPRAPGSRCASTSCTARCITSRRATRMPGRSPA